jgi:hypothetical protein
MGFDHRRLTYLYNGLDQRLTGVTDRQIMQQVLKSSSSTPKSSS